MEIELIRWGRNIVRTIVRKIFRKVRLKMKIQARNMENTIQRWFRIREAWPDDASGANRAFA